MRTSLLMRDSSENDGHIETMLDYILSWTLRRASMDYSTDKAILLHEYCRDILFKLLNLNNYGQVKVLSVETWKQWNHIDLHVNVELEYNGSKEYHAILIENKAYTKVHDNQLERYRQIFEETYRESPFEKHLHFVLITCFDNVPDSIIEVCQKADYEYLPLLDLFPNEGKKDSESDLFNEFWLRQW